MNVTSVRTFFVDPGGSKNWLFVKVETDAGIHGWGECYTQADRDRAIEMHVQQLGRYLVGRNPFDIKHTMYVLYTDWATRRGAMDFYCAVSGVEHALWDIVGKACNQPVYNLLGGRSRDKVRVYANGWGEGGGLDKLVAATAAAGRSHRSRIADLLIAAVAHANNLPLYTRNPQDFVGLEAIVAVRAI